MKNPYFPNRRGFTLLETVIAIGVLAVLLSGFMLVFTPAAEGIRKSINVQQADRLTTTLEQQLTTVPANETTTYPTGFDKAFAWIKESSSASNALIVYQYRGDFSAPRTDGTPTPVATIGNKLPGKDFVVVSMVRRKGDSNLAADLAALEGPVYVVKCTQLVYNNGEMKLGTAGEIKDPKNGTPAANADAYPEAVISFSADFYQMPSTSPGYLTGDAFNKKFATLKTPVFSRNLGVRR